jgi:N-terminal domain with HPIH motif
LDIGAVVLSSTMISPLVAVASRAALYPIQSIIVIALVVSGAYFHLLDIARNSPGSRISSGDNYSSSTTLVPIESTIWAKKNSDGWKWSVDPVFDIEHDVLIFVLLCV